MRLSIIVPVYEQWESCSSILNQLLPYLERNSSTELIIVDNGSKHVPELSKLSDTRVSVLKCEKPGSYSARNFGLEFAQGELILFTDADCLPDEAWLSRMLSAYETSDQRSLLAGNIIIISDNMSPSVAELYDIAAGLPQERYVSKGYAVTANLAIPRAVFDEIGGFDDSRFSGGDADMCQRALSAGFQLKFVPDAVVYHPARKTWAEYATKVRRMKGGQIRAGKLSRRMKYFCLTLLPPVWRFWRTLKSHKLKPTEKLRVLWFQFRLWGVELTEMSALLCGKTPERR